MLSRYSTSPTLNLTIGKSRLRTALYALLCLATCLALGLIHQRGHTALALMLAPVTLVLLWRLRIDSAQGGRLYWYGGTWLLQNKDGQRSIEVGARSIALPWLIYLAYRDATLGRDGHLWLFADSLSPEGARQLRVRLTLQH